jgi:hypothetical protein
MGTTTGGSPTGLDGNPFFIGLRPDQVHDLLEDLRHRIVMQLQTTAPEKVRNSSMIPLRRRISSRITPVRT